MSEIVWIMISTIAISALALVGAFTFFVKEKVLQKMIFPLVAFSAGSLLGGALLHLIPEAIKEGGEMINVFLFVILGFSMFFLLEQFIHWHHCHRIPSEHKQAVTYLVLIADGVHNFLDGIAVGSAFMIDIHLGIVTSLAVAMHEIPQELGDFGILIHGGWHKKKALLFNLISGIPMVFGGVLAWSLSDKINIVFLVPLAAGGFLYIAASDLIPEIKHHDDFCQNGLHFIAFSVGILLMYGLLFLNLG